MQDLTGYLYVLFLSWGICALLTLPVRRLALLIGAIDRPDGQRRVHAMPTPRLGGIAILSAIFAVLSLVTAFGPYLDLPTTSLGLWNAVPALAIVALLGVADDIIGLSPSTKMAVELLAAILAYTGGFRIATLFGAPLGILSLPTTVLWIVAVTNAFNLVDGMDGLAAGVGTIISATLFILSLSLGSVPGALVLAALMGALAGFLLFNSPPAQIFLGDSGSLSIGLILSLVSIETSNKLAAGIAFLVPALAMGLPLAEITITVVRRTLRRIHVVRREEGKERYEFLFVGKAAMFSADRDHIHHRLLSLGLSRGKAVLALYSATLFACIAGFAVSVSRGLSQALVLAICGVAALVAVRQLGYEELRPLRRGTLMPIFYVRGLNLKPFRVLVDLFCINTSYVAAFAVCTADGRFGFSRRLGLSLPLLCLGQLSVLIVSGLYRRSYRYASVADIGPLVRSITLAGLVSFFVMWFIAGTPAIEVSLLDTYFLGTLIFASRLSFRLLDHARSRSMQQGRPVLIYGAGRAGLVALTELRSNPALGRFAIGFLDDDQSKQGSRLWGLPVHGAIDLSKLVEGGEFVELLITSAKIPRERLRDITFRCINANIAVRRLMLEFRQVPTSTETIDTVPLKMDAFASVDGPGHEQ